MIAHGLTRCTTLSARVQVNPDARRRKYVIDALRQIPWWHITKTFEFDASMALL
jgi:predicted dithiol-disulfide oxidoreductase (DUF899 family)